jgi:hypothetical protein
MTPQDNRFVHPMVVQEVIEAVEVTTFAATNAVEEGLSDIIAYEYGLAYGYAMMSLELPVWSLLGEVSLWTMELDGRWSKHPNIDKFLAGVP